jgi:hypothetical protein
MAYIKGHVFGGVVQYNSPDSRYCNVINYDNMSHCHTLRTPVEYLIQTLNIICNCDEKFGYDHPSYVALYYQPVAKINFNAQHVKSIKIEKINNIYGMSTMPIRRLPIQQRQKIINTLHKEFHSVDPNIRLTLNYFKSHSKKLKEIREKVEERETNFTKSIGIRNSKEYFKQTLKYNKHIYNLE